MLGSTRFGGGRSFLTSPSAAPFHSTSSRKVIDIIQVAKDESTKSNVKKAYLSANKKERIKLPQYVDARGGKTYRISEFLSHPTGIGAILNFNALENCQSLDSNTYRCTLPAIQLLNFEVSPVLDLQVSPTGEDCTVELLSCKFEGSELVERQNKHFSASMKNHITWDQNDSESFLHVDVKLNICLELYNQPFILLPVSAVEGPGNIVMQALLERFVPLLLQQLSRDYENWVRQQCTRLS